MLSMRGFTTVCIIVQLGSTFNFKEKIYGLSLLTLKWMKKWKAEAGGNRFLYKTTVKVDNKSKCVLRGNIVTVV